jgi:hypothetical protein
MALTFLGKDPDSDINGSPTIYLDEAADEYVLQGWVPDEETITEINSMRPIPGGETAIRFPRRMMPFFPEVTGDQHKPKSPHDTGGNGRDGGVDGERDA